MNRPGSAVAAVVGVLGLLFAAAGAGGDELVWRDLHSRAAGLWIELPGEPEYERTSRLTLGGRVEQHHYWLEVMDARFDVERIDLPFVATLVFSSARLLEIARDDLIEEFETRIDLEEHFELQGHPARRLRFRRLPPPIEPEEVWLVLADRHLYIVSAGPYLARAREPLVDRVFASFRVCLESADDCPGESGPDQSSSDQRS